ncbi:MAG: glutathione transferase GstA [Planctomycetota bacterium]|nr:MAG: glutathione transferase GstA [Planctomycetota bacterium]
MQLFYKPGACSLAVHIALREVGASFELVRVDRKTGRTETGEDFRAINPKGYVPALRLDDGDVLTEGVVLLQYVGDQHPELGFVEPFGTRARYHQMERLHFLATELHKAFGPLSKPGHDEAAKARAREQVAARLAELEADLAPGPYFGGERFTAPDCYLAVMLLWVRFLGLETPPCPRLDALLQRVLERPAVQAALEAEGIAQRVAELTR